MERTITLKGRTLRIKSMRRYVLLRVPSTPTEQPYILWRSDSLEDLINRQEGEFIKVRSTIYDMNGRTHVRQHDIPRG